MFEEIANIHTWDVVVVRRRLEHLARAIQAEEDRLEYADPFAERDSVLRCLHRLGDLIQQRHYVELELLRRRYAEVPRV
ncbi:MAG: hypothetical protein EPO21_13035 [Chloroflexota bacterium]|nr:MAG: hypothetical protein EPO21_13035 [Chloroflexota bacterium]